jgi:hypothetical protein
MRKANPAPQIDIEVDAGPSVQSPKDLARIVTLAREMFQLEKEVAQLQIETLDKTKRIGELSLNLLPEALMQVGMAEFKLENGFSIKLVDFVRASIPTLNSIAEESDAMERASKQARRDRALAWLRDNNADSLIKNKLTAEFGKGQDKAAKQFHQAIEKAGYHAHCEESVHPQTLNSFLREQLRNGVDIPTEPFSLFTGSKAALTAPPKAKK